MADKLNLYNRALRKLGQTRLATLTDAGEPRRILDDHWTETLLYALEQGFWKWALRTVELPASTDIEPDFGPQYAFEKPEDFQKLYALSANGSLDPPLNEFIEEKGVYYADVDTIYLRYVSNDAAWGLDLGLWPETFAEYIATRLARQACRAMTQSDSMVDELKKDERAAKMDALSKDAISTPPRRLPLNSWALARSGGRGPLRLRDSGELV